MIRLLCAADVAELLGLSVSSFRQRRRKLETAGFPACVAGLTVQRWDPAAIEAWLGRQNGAATNPPPDDIEAWRAELHRRVGVAA